jgi:hypothetical protein
MVFGLCVLNHKAAFVTEPTGHFSDIEHFSLFIMNPLAEVGEIGSIKSPCKREKGHQKIISNPAFPPLKIRTDLSSYLEPCG